jgi:hypothetical protein
MHRETVEGIGWVTDADLQGRPISVALLLGLIMSWRAVGRLHMASLVRMMLCRRGVCCAALHSNASP